MSILLIGGDRLGNITKKLKESGFNKIEHISGRKSGDRKIKISEKTDLVLIFVDFVEHKLTEIVKEQTKRSDMKVAFAKRSWAHMETIIKQCVVEIENSKQ